MQSLKSKITRLTILEIYADSAAYNAHIQTPHFLKYKNGTLNMVKSPELVKTDPLIPVSHLRFKVIAQLIVPDVETSGKFG
jgi:hypothetical protein